MLCCSASRRLSSERYDQAQTAVENEANELGDLFRDAQAFPDGVRNEIETKVRSYIRLVMEKEWPAMAEHKSSLEDGGVDRLRQTYRRFTPQTEQERRLGLSPHWTSSRAWQCAAGNVLGLTR